jgi:hypothetical protein
LPASPFKEVSTQEYKQVADNHKAHMPEKAEMLNSLAGSDWEANLETLDAAVASLRIEGFPSTEITGTEFHLVSPAGGGELVFGPAAKQ